MNPLSRRTTPQVPSDQESARSRGGLLGELDLSSFVRRLGNVLDFWGGSAQQRDERDPMAQVAQWAHEAWEKRGKVASLMAIANVADAYGKLDDAGKDAFFALLRDEFAADVGAMQHAATELLALHESAPVTDSTAGADALAGARAKALVALQQSLESPRLALFELFNTIPTGVKFLVDLRADLLARLKRDPSLAPLEYELQRLLASFFNVGFLHLERIQWDSPAALLEKLVEYEAVNQIRNWQDLKHRLIADRACFAFLHPAMPCEPVIFVEVALVRGMADNIQRLLDPNAPDLRPDQADTAIFYGITNAQRGLRGIPFGNLLIKKVATRLRGEVPSLETFATLSPLPGFRTGFLDGAIEDGSIAEFFDKDEAQRLREVTRADSTAAAVQALLSDQNWVQDPAATAVLKPGLLRAARRYLTETVRDGHAACPVAHFHGSNGALLARINWLGDTSEHGVAQSAGIMVNYLYDMDRFEAHQAHYLRTGHIAVAERVRKL